MTGSSAIDAVGVEKSFGATKAVDGADVSVAEGQIAALLGPSGSGKTTLLRVIAGFEVPDAGTVSIGGRIVAGDGMWEEPDRRRIGMVFQDGALFPHLNVTDNVKFGGPRAGKVEECLVLVGLEHRAASYPHELSGGERQRIALARALATEPEVVLLDEPFASLDAGLRIALREDVATILRQAGATALFVTHDQQEALSLADLVIVMREGRVEQAGSPEEIYAHPASRWAAEFLGVADVLPGQASAGVVDTPLGRFPVEPGVNGSVDVVVRPESIAVQTANGSGTTGTVPARVVSRSYFGHDQLLVLELAGGLRIRSRCPGTATWRGGDDVRVRVDGTVSVLAPSSAPAGSDTR